jgi:hypothetical protein
MQSTPTRCWRVQKVKVSLSLSAYQLITCEDKGFIPIVFEKILEVEFGIVEERLMKQRGN